VIAGDRKGFEVAPVSPKNLRELLPLRQMLECHALEQSFRSGNMDWEARVVAAHHRLARMEERMAQATPPAPSSGNSMTWQFHQALISACGSKMPGRHPRGGCSTNISVTSAGAELSLATSRRASTLCCSNARCRATPRARARF